MKFWELKEPWGSDYEHVKVSGKLHHPYRLPTAICEACEEKLSEWNTVLPFECPASMREHPLLTDSEAEVPLKEFRKLEKTISAEMHHAEFSKLKLRPGACLQPGFLDVPAVPVMDFLWSDLWSGLSAILVNERVVDLVGTLCKDSVVFCPVNLRKVGKRAAKTAPRLPKSGEPEDMMQHYPAGKASGVGPYYHMIINAQSGYPPGAAPTFLCSTCGTELPPDWKSEHSPSREHYRKQQEAWTNLTASILESIWDGAPIFRLADKGTVLITDTLKTRLEEIQASNVCFHVFPTTQPSAPLNRRPASHQVLQKARNDGGR
ncbi:MAG: hypothetical protein WCO56_14895 [Verrucomicrobiota bacterium]